MKAGLCKASRVSEAGLVLTLGLAWPTPARAEVIVTAQCGGCGYATGMLGLGGGMTTYQTLSLFPPPAGGGRWSWSISWTRTPAPGNGTNLPRVDYRDPSLRRGQGEKVVAAWGEAVLYDEDYLCPACGELQLRFTEAGCWD